VLGLALGLLGAVDTFRGLALVGGLAGLGNGLSSGLVMTLGTDLAPRAAADRAQFIGVYRLIADAGNIIGPLVSGVVVGAAGVSAAGLSMMGVGAAAAVYARCGLPETLARRG
jgi:MFS family permease